MTISMKKMIYGIPHPIITSTIGVFTYEFIKLIGDELTGNALTVPTNLGCGTIGYAHLTLTSAVYANISIDVPLPPPSPVMQYIFPENSTGPQITYLNRNFDMKYTMYQVYITIRTTLKNISLQP